MTAPARTLFLGSGTFALPILNTLAVHASVELVAILTAPPRPAGRGAKVTETPVAARAGQLECHVLTPHSLRTSEALAELESFRLDLIVLADYGRLIPPAILALPPRGALNLHPSLLPRHRGATPIPATILAGDEISGVSLIVMDEGIDTGPLVAQDRVRVPPFVTAADLETRLAAAAAALLGRTLQGWLAGSVAAQPQAQEGSTMTRPLRRADGVLSGARAAADLERQVRAYQPWPGSWIDTAHGRLTVWRAAAIHESRTEAGRLVSLGEGGGIGFTTVSGTLELLEVQPAGGRRMSGAALLRGRPGLVGERVGVVALP